MPNVTDTITKAIERVRAFLASGRMSARKFADKAGVHRNSLNNHDAADWSPKPETLERYIQAIDAIEREDREARARRKERPKLAAA